MKRAEQASTSPARGHVGYRAGYRAGCFAEAPGFRLLGRRLGRARGFVLLALLLALSGGASLLEDAALPLWANLAALYLAFLLAYGALMRLSDAELPDEPWPFEASMPASEERGPAKAPPGGLSFGAEGSGGLSAARRARPLDDPDDPQTSERRPA